MKKTILITGGTGFIGKALCKHLVDKGNKLLVLTREESLVNDSPVNGIHYLQDVEHLGDNIAIDAIINLAGEPLDKHRWNDCVKQELVSSRVDMTNRLSRFIDKLDKAPDVFISGSAIGWYGDQGEQQLVESSPPGNDCFSHQLCQQWEEASARFESIETRLVNLRIGIVLEKDGGPLKALLPSFRLGAGGKIGSGAQYWSWIHRHDLVRLIDFIIENDNISGPVNATSPHALPQKTFAQILAKTLSRPCLLGMPASLAKLALGEFAEEILLHGQNVYPEKAITHGFSFTYPKLDDALVAILNK